jgi:hypothetical protein
VNKRMDRKRQQRADRKDLILLYLAIINAVIGVLTFIIKVLYQA